MDGGFSDSSNACATQPSQPAVSTGMLNEVTHIPFCSGVEVSVKAGERPQIMEGSSVHPGEHWLGWTPERGSAMQSDHNHTGMETWACVFFQG